MSTSIAFNSDVAPQARPLIAWYEKCSARPGLRQRSRVVDRTAKGPLIRGEKTLPKGTRFSSFSGVIGLTMAKTVKRSSKKVALGRPTQDELEKRKARVLAEAEELFHDPWICWNKHVRPVEANPCFTTTYNRSFRYQGRDIYAGYPGAKFEGVPARIGE